MRYLNFLSVLELYIPAVDHDRSLASRVFLHHPLVEGQDGRGIVGHSVVRPGSEVEVRHSK